MDKIIKALLVFVLLLIAFYLLITVVFMVYSYFTLSPSLVIPD